MTAALDAIPSVLTAQADELGEGQEPCALLWLGAHGPTANQWNYRNTGVTYPDAAFPEAKMRVDVMCYRRAPEMAYGTRFRTALAEVQQQGGSRYDILKVICTAIVTRLSLSRGIARQREWRSADGYYFAAVPTWTAPPLTDWTPLRMTMD